MYLWAQILGWNAKINKHQVVTKRSRKMKMNAIYKTENGWRAEYRIYKQNREKREKERRVKESQLMICKKVKRSRWHNFTCFFFVMNINERVQNLPCYNVSHFVRCVLSRSCLQLVTRKIENLICIMRVQPT